MVFAFYETAGRNDYIDNIINPAFTNNNAILQQSGDTVTTFKSSFWSTVRVSYEVAFNGGFTFSDGKPASGTIQKLQLDTEQTSLSNPNISYSSRATFYDVQMTYAQYESYFDEAIYATHQQKQALAQFLYRANDRIEGSTSSDTLLGFDGNDVIWGSNPDATSDSGDVLLGNNGDDIIHGGDGDDSIVGGSALVDDGDTNDVLYGGSGSDDIYGSGGNDLIYGGTGNDLIVGGAHNDILHGGTGNDSFVFVLGGGYDTVVDFTQGDILSIERTSTVTDAASALANIISDAYGTFIDLGNGSGITLAVTQPGELDASDFLFYG